MDHQAYTSDQNELPDPTTKVVEQYRVSPPPAAVPDTVLPTTFFDVLWLFVGPVKRLFFYPSPGITTHGFLTTHLPALRRSLSLTLRSYFSLAGNLLLPDLTIAYADGDSVPLLVAESEGDFARLTADGPKDVELARPLVPPLPPAEGGRAPLLAVQFTVFPGAGFSLGVTIHHAATDGSSSARFLKSWAAIHRSDGGPSAAEELPIYDRGELRRLDEDKKGFLEDMKEAATKWEHQLKVSPEKTNLGQSVRATFVLTRAEIDKLRRRIMPITDVRPSTFVAAVSHVWVCLTKARGDDDRIVYLGFAADCRTRIDPPVPSAYFGNCIGVVSCEASGPDLVRPDGLIVAAKTVQAGIRALEGRVVVGLRETIRKYSKSDVRGLRVLSIAGSPRLAVYGIDFGWGSPKKVEVISIEEGEAMSLAESRDGDGGLEIGMVGPAAEMERFGCLLKTSLDSF